VILVSFDIDGTLELGVPPGPITMAQVAEAKSRGYLIGSASDRTLSDQRRMWESAGIEVDFICNKHTLTPNTEHFTCTRRVHIGDSWVDEHYAELAGFEFFHVDSLPAAATPGWVY
jgi:hypothetical protein